MEVWGNCKQVDKSGSALCHDAYQAMDLVEDGYLEQVARERLLRPVAIVW